MGQEIVYCAQCASRLVGADFDRGKAFRAGGRIVCAACLPQVVPGLTPQEQEEVVSLSSTKMKTVKSSPSPSSSHGTSVRLTPSSHPPETKSPLPLILAGVGALLVLGIAVAAMGGRSARPPEQPVATAPIPKPPPPPVDKGEELQIREARAAMEAAREKMKSAPRDLDAQIAAWEEAVRKSALTPFHREASIALQEIRVKREALNPPPPVEPEKKGVVKVEPPPVKPPSLDLNAYLPRWDAAMTKASARDFDAALAELGRAAAELGDDAVKQQARADADLLGRARTTLAEGRSALAQLSRGQSVKLRVRSPAGEWKPVEGTVVRAAAGRVELRQGDGTVFVESEDVSAASLAKVTQATGQDRHLWAVLALLEGDREGAEGLADGDALAVRYWDYASGAPAKVPKTPPRELEARSRFYAAEREFLKMDTLPAAVAKYKSLADDYADTRVAKDESARIQKRAQAGRDYVFVAGAIKGTGTFTLGPSARTEVAWISKADIDEAKAVENYVEVEFAALPETTYRCWALVAGCCAETLVFYLQTTEATELHPKTRQKTPIDPGAGLAALVKHSISGLKKLHEDHKAKGAKVHPKTPARWEWVSIPLPKYSAVGAKKIRLMSDQQGFGVGAIVVSSTRTAVMPEAELKEEVARARAAFAATEPGLIGWWRMDDGAGTAVVDSVDGGHAGTFVGTPKWAAGKAGGGLKFDPGNLVRIDSSFSLSTITLAAWVKHDTLSGALQRYVTFGNEVAVIRCERNGGAHFYIRTNGQLRHVLVPGSLEAGKWIHIVGTWDGHTQKLYKDGDLIGSGTPGGKLDGAMTKVLLSFTSGESMLGLLDEVRIYDRALSDPEVKKLFADGTIAEFGAEPPPPPGKPWRPLFDGKTADCIKSNSWRYENGALAYISGTDDAAQTREVFTDGELRIRFELKDVQRFWFVFRQGGGGGYGISFDNGIKSLEGKPHELIITASGDNVTATLDGKPVPVSANGSPKSGCLQFNSKGAVARILALDVR